MKSDPNTGVVNRTIRCVLEENRFSPERTRRGQHSGDISVLAAPRGTVELPVLTLTAEEHKASRHERNYINSPAWGPNWNR